MQQDDRKILDELLLVIHDELEAIVYSRRLFRWNLGVVFPGPWHIVSDAIERGRDDLRAADWNALAVHGLTGFSLAFSRDLLEAELDASGTLAGFFVRVNAMLDSLSRVLQSIHQVKAYALNVAASVYRLDQVVRIRRGSTEMWWRASDEEEVIVPGRPR